jgi:hypothetical protein
LVDKIRILSQPLPSIHISDHPQSENSRSISLDKTWPASQLN